MDDEARAVLAAKKNLRVVVADLARAFGPQVRRFDVRSIFDGLLVQARDAVVEASKPWPADAAGESGVRVVTRRQPTPDEWRSLRFAWRVCAHVKSNAVIFTGADRTLAVGAGQMSRVDAVSVAVAKAVERAAAGALPGGLVGLGGGFRRVLSLQGRPRRGRCRGGDGRRPAGRIGAGRRGDRGGRRARAGDGLHRTPALQALSGRFSGRRASSSASPGGHVSLAGRPACWPSRRPRTTRPG